MAKNGLIDEVVSKGGLNSIDKLNEKLAKSVELLEKAITISGGKNPFGDPKKANEISKSITDIQIAEQQLNKEIALRIKAEKELAALQEKQIAKKQASIKKTEDEKAATLELNRVKKLEAQLARSVEGSYSALSAQYELNRIKINKLAIDSKKLSDADKQLIKDTANLRVEMKRSQEATGNHTLNVGNYASAWSAATGVMGKLSAVTGVAGNSLLEFGKKFAPLAAGAGIIYGLFSAFKSAYNAVKEFDAAMANVNAITGATKSELNQLKELAVNLGGSTKFTATEIAGLETELAKLGYTTNQVIASTEAITLAASATGEGLARTAEIVGSTTMAFGLTATESQSVADVMAQSFNKTALSLEDFAESIKYVAPVSKQAGISIEETAALLGVLANSGIKGSMAGTSLRNIFTELIGTGGNLQDKIEDLAKKGLNLASAEDEVGKRAQTSLLILKDAIKTIPSLTVELENAGGAAKEMADKQLDSLAGATKLMTSAWNGFVLSIDNGTGKFSTSIKSMILDATNAINGFKKFLQSDEDFAIDSTKRVTNERIKTLKSILPSQKDQMKYLSQEIVAEQGVYKAKQQRIAQINTTIASNNAAGGAWVKNNKALQEEANGLQKSINGSIAYVNAVAGLRESKRQEAEQAKKVAAIVKDNQKTEEEAVDSKVEAYNKFGLILKPIIDKTKDLASNDLLSYADRRNAANDWAEFMQMSEAESLKIKEDALYKEYQEALKTTKDKAGLDIWYKTEKEKIEIESSNTSIEIEDEYSKMFAKIKADELKDFKDNKDKQDDIDEKAKEASIKRAEAIKDKLDQLKEDVRRGVYDMVYQTLDAVGTLFDKINEKEEEALSRKQKNDDEAFNKKEELINNSLISESDKQEQLDALDAERVKNQEEYAKKETEIKKKQAIENAIISAAMIWARYFETIASYRAAQAAFVLTALGNPVAIAAGEALYGTLRAQALVQALIGTAAVAIPAFEKGGEMKHDGLAMVSEKRQEWGINPDGSVFLTPDRPSIVHLQKGARIFPDASQMTNEAIMRVSADAAVYNFSTKDMEATFSREINGLKTEIRKLQPVQKKDRLMDEIRYSNVLRRFKN